MWTWWAELAGKHSQDELRRQHDLIERMEARRRILALLPFLISMLFISPLFCLVMMILNGATETLGIRLLRQLDPARQPERYYGSLCSFVVAQCAYMAMPALIWQLDQEMAKAFAVGLFLINVVNVATVRTVHLPLATVSLVTASLIAVVSNTWFWVAQGNWLGLAISSVAVVAVAYFVRVVTSTVHGLHQEMAENQLAAEVANSAKTRFLAQMSHELRTPLNAIMGMGHAAMDTAEPGERKEQMSIMMQSARSLALLLDDILDMSAAQAGQMPIRPEDVDLRQVIGNTLALFGQQFAEAGQTLTVSIAPDLPQHARLDGQRLRQCLSNILSNATKYAGKGEVAVKVALAGPGQLAVLVRDNGPGVPVEMEEAIFEPFLRGDAAGSGTGLGLSISRTLARRMGGDLVLLHGNPGAQFYLTLTFEPPQTEDRVDDLPDLADLTGLRFLVVDDIATNRLVAMSHLRMMGALAHEAASGAEAVALLPELAPDAVLLDMLMPGHDGLETLAAIRALPGAAARVPVIAMTADVTDAGRSRYRAAGMDGFIGKPFSPKALGACLRAVLPARP